MVVPAPPPPAVLFANPTAQSGRAADWVKRARALLDEVGIDHRFVATEPHGGTIEIVQRAIDEDGARLVIYMGGDGTFAEVAKGILRSGHAATVRLGMLPTGTANDQGKSFGLSAGPGALADNVRVIASGSTIALDVGRIQLLDADGKSLHSDLFFDSASIGFGAATLATRNRDRELVSAIPVLRNLYRDNLVYAGALMRRFLETYVADVKFDLEATIDGKVYQFRSLLDVILKNTHIFGGEWVLDPDAESDDGLFELVPVAGRRDFTSKMLATYRHSPISDDDLRALGIEHSEPITGASFDLRVVKPGAEPPEIQIDGEEFPRSDRVRVDVLARVLRLIVPRDAAR
jgi:diacylglycerol kinase family enzyme